MKIARLWITGIAAWTAAAAMAGEVYVQDVARLQGQRTNKLFGFGLVVGLNGTGDGGDYGSTMRALMALHRNFHQPVLGVEELEGNDNVAIVSVEATIPEFGAREGEAIDVVVSALGPAESLAGGQLLTTPLQESTLSVPDILALAGGRVDLADRDAPTRGIIRRGATLEAEFFYNFVADGALWLVLDEQHTGYPWAQVVARAINHELANPAQATLARSSVGGDVLVQRDLAVAVGPKNIRVQLPPEYAGEPTPVISRILQTKLFVTPRQQARVVINRSTKNVSMTGSVTVSPTVLQLPGIGTIAIGGGRKQSAEGQADPDDRTEDEIEFEELIATLSALQLDPDQMIAAVEQLHRTGTLHAQLVYTE